jgi:serine/threonine protein kinase
VPVYDYHDDGEWRYFVMPYMSGGSLQDKLEKGAIPLKKALLILYRIAAGLDKAHSNGIVHRDLKPGNILFDEDEEAYLSDFGIMKLADPTGSRTVQMTQTGLALGTPHYMSPEQLDGAGDLDGRSDIYALGIILYEMLTGQKPYDHESMARVIAMHYSHPVPNILEANPNLPPAIADVIRTAMAKKREERYNSAKTFYNRAVEVINEPKKTDTKPQMKIDVVPKSAVKHEAAKEKPFVPPTQKPQPDHAADNLAASGDLQRQKGSPRASYSSLFFHLFMGLGLVHHNKRLLRGWLYPLCFIYSLCLYSICGLGGGADFCNDQISYITFLVGIGIYLLGFVDIFRQVRRRKREL